MPRVERIESDGGPDLRVIWVWAVWYLGGIYPVGSGFGSVSGGEKNSKVQTVKFATHSFLRGRPKVSFDTQGTLFYLQ